MISILLTPVQRLNLRAIIRVQQPSTMAILEALHDILEKIEFSKEELTQIDKGDNTVDLTKLGELPNRQVELEKAEVKLIKELLQPSEKFKPTVSDLFWLKSLLTLLDKKE